MNAQLIQSYEADGCTNRSLTKSEIANKLADHGVNHYTNDKGELIATETYGNGDIDTTNTTGWMLYDLLNFLNY